MKRKVKTGICNSVSMRSLLIFLAVCASNVVFAKSEAVMGRAATTLESSSQQPSASVSWNTFVAFVEEHAVDYTQATLEAIKADVLSGNPTWVLELEGSNAVTLVGSKLGLPGTPNFITFSSDSDAIAAALMLDDVWINPSTPLF
ncbi:MAG: hypothetical protein R2688_10640 [Fimbriimonadaceae bacterium]